MATAQALTDTYQDVELLLYDICYKFRRKHGGDLEELFSMARQAFMEAYWSFDRDKAQFSTWITWNVRRHLLDHKRRQAIRNSILARVEADLTEMAVEFRLPFQDEISADAREVIQLALQMPATLKLDAKRHGGKARHFRKSLYDFLRGLDWSRQRILQAFEEVKETLYQ